MSKQKNVASQKLRVRALDAAGSPVTGDAANITCKVSKDGGSLTATNDTNPSELEAGYYEFDLTQAETNADDLLFVAVSATSAVYVDVIDGANGATIIDRAIKAVTDNLPDSGALTTINTNASTAATQSTAGASSAAAVQAKLPAGGKVIAAAGDSVLDLDGVNSGGTSAPFLNRVPQDTVKVSSRADGYLTSNRVRVVAGENRLVALEYPNPNRWLFGMTLPVSPDTDVLTIESDEYGLNRNLAMVEVTIAADAPTGSTITLPVTVQPTQGTTDKRLVLFEVIAPTQ